MDDLDYLFSTARIRAMETKLLNRERLLRMINAKSMEEAIRVLMECGWEESVDFSTYEAMERSLYTERQRTFTALTSFAPDKSLIHVFQLKYDYHNIKAILKGMAQDKDYTAMLSTCGCIDPKRLAALINEGDYTPLSPAMRKAVTEAREVLNRTRDPQYADTVLDRACYGEMLTLAKNSNSSFLLQYVQLLIDSINLRTAVRLKVRGLSYDYLRQFFISGGSIAINRLLTDLTPDMLGTIFATTPLQAAAVCGGNVLRKEATLSQLDIACDNAIMEYLHSAKYIGLGEQPLIGYLAGKEAELVAVRIIMTGRLAHMDSNAVQERLRETYV